MQHSAMAVSSLPLASRVIVTLAATVVGSTAIIIKPTRIQSSTSLSSVARTTLTMANITAGKNSRENVCVNKCDFQFLSWCSSAELESVKPVMRKMSAMQP